MVPRLVFRAVLVSAWLVALPIGVASAQQRVPPDLAGAEEAMRAAERLPPGDVRRSGPMSRLAIAYWRSGRREQAVALMRQVIELRGRMQGPQQPELLAQSLNELGFWLRELNRPAESGPVLQRGLQIAERTPALAQSPLMGNLLSNLASIRTIEGKPDEARRLQERAVAVRVAAAQAAAGRDNREAQSNILWRLALSYDALERRADAVSAIQRAVQVREAARATDDVEYAAMLVDQGALLRTAERYDESLQVLQRALPLNERLRGANDRIVGNLVYQIAATQRDMGRYDLAETSIRRAIAIRERNADEDLALAQALRLGGRIAAETQRYEDGERMLLRAQAIFEHRQGANSINVADVLRVRGFNLARAGRHAEAEPIYRRALAIRETTQGRRHADLTLVLAELGTALNQLGRLDEAGTVLERGLALTDATPSLGAQSDRAAQIALALAVVRGAQGRPADAQALRDRAIAARESVVRALEARQAPPLATSGALQRLAFAYGELGQVRDEARVLARAVELRERAFGPDNAELAPLLGALGYALRDVGTGEDAERALRRAIAIDERTRGAQHPELAQHLFYLGIVTSRMGRFADAEQAYRRALAIHEANLGPDHPNVGRVAMLLGRVMLERGRTVEAERLEQRAIAIFEARYGRDHVQVAEGLRALALLYTRTGRAAMAEPLLRRGLEIRERAFGPDHPFIAAQLNDVGFNLSFQGRQAEALPFLERAVAIIRRVQGDSLEVANSYDLLARALRFAGRVEDAEVAAREALSIRERRLGPDSDRVAGALSTLGRIALQRGRAAEAETMLRRAVAIHERGLGPDSTVLGWDLHGLALALDAQDHLPEAVEAVRRAAAIMARRGTRGGDDTEPDSDSDQNAERRTFRTVFVDHVAMLYRLAEQQPEAERPALVAEAFMSAQLAQAGGTATALARMADRFATGDDALGQLLRQRGDLAERLAAIDHALIAALAGSAREDAADATRLRSEGAEVRRQVAALDQQIARDFPAYQRLIAGDGVPLADVQRLLGPDEALLSYLSSAVRTHIFVIRRDRAALVRSDSSGPTLAREVRALRQGLDPSAVTSIETLPRYDLARAYGLYRRIFEPVEPLLDGATQVFVAPDGPLQSLPFAVMTSAPPPRGPREQFAAYRDAPWLARRYAFTTLPAPAALRALRDFARPSRASEPFIGFGDPALEGTPAGASGGEQGNTRGGARAVSIAAVFTRGGQIDLRSVRALPPLPETADELRALAASLHAPSESVHLRGAMTVASVRATDLSRYRVIAFATHGLTAGELEGVAEPGLIMTPPATQSDEDSGILTATMIARLNLDADWVILSACNTAAADGTPGAEALSGLARAFFYAGSRALLVSHWAVASQAAERLTTGLFAAAAAAPEIGRAEALRRSMLRLLGEGEETYFAHPLFWAPFVVVGEGGRLQPGG